MSGASRVIRVQAGDPTKRWDLQIRVDGSGTLWAHVVRMGIPGQPFQPSPNDYRYYPGLAEAEETLRKEWQGE